MTDDPATAGGVDRVAGVVTGPQVVVAGHRGDEATARRGLSAPDDRVRAAGLGALVRMGSASVADLLAALRDESPRVRRRACQEAAHRTGRGSRSTLPEGLRAVLADPDPLVVEAACWALGELGYRPAVDDLAVVAGTHEDTRCREAAVAALGALGDPRGLPAVLERLNDKPTVRRRAVVALAAFDGPEVDAALQRAPADRDWQVREAAEVLLGD